MLNLSTDRANAARRALEGAGLATDRVSRVVGLSSSVLFDRTYPRNPVNRRISLVVLTQEAEQDAVKMDVPALAADAQAPSPAVASSAGGPIAAPFDRPINPPMATAPAPVPKR